MNNRIVTQSPLFCFAIMCFVTIVACGKEQTLPAKVVDLADPVEMLDPEPDITDINYPPEFDECYSEHNFDSTQQDRLGWVRAIIDSVEYFGYALYIDWPEGSDRYDLRFHFYNYESCYGYFSLYFGDTGLSTNDPHNGVTPYGTEWSACNVNGRRIRYELERPYRQALLSYLNHDAPLQYFIPDEAGPARARLIVDQVDSTNDFVRGRFAGRFLAGEECPEELRHYGDEVIIQEGYFEAAEYRR